MYVYTYSTVRHFSYSDTIQSKIIIILAEFFLFLCFTEVHIETIISSYMYIDELRSSHSVSLIIACFKVFRAFLAVDGRPNHLRKCQFADIFPAYMQQQILGEMKWETFDNNRPNSKNF